MGTEEESPVTNSGGATKTGFAEATLRLLELPSLPATLRLLELPSFPDPKSMLMSPAPTWSTSGSAIGWMVWPAAVFLPA